MDKRLEQTRRLLQELERQAKEIASFTASYEDNIYVDLVKQHTARALKEVEIALSFLSLTDD